MIPAIMDLYLLNQKNLSGNQVYWIEKISEFSLRVCSDANATTRVVLGLGVDGISKHPNTVIT